MLTWLGIVGGALTLLSNLQGILDLAKWADWLIFKWQQLVPPLVYGLIALFDVRVSGEATSMIAMALFVSLIAIGSRVETKFQGVAREAWPIQASNVFNHRVLLGIILYMLQGVLITLPAYLPSVTRVYLEFPYSFLTVCYFLYCSAIVIGLRGWPLSTSIVVAASMVGFSFIFSYSTHDIAPPNVSETASVAIAGACAVACGLIVVGIAPPLAFTRRIIFMVIGVSSVLMLSQLSHWAIALTP